MNVNGNLQEKSEYIEIKKDELKRLYQQILDYEQIINSLKRQNLKLDQELTKHLNYSLETH